MEQVIKITRATKTNAEGLAACLGVSRQRVQQLVQEGVLNRDDAGKYMVPENIQRFLNYKNGGDEKGTVTYDSERAMHEQTKRKISEIHLAKLEHRVHDARSVELVMTDMLSNLRTQLQGMPSILSGQLTGKSQEEICEIMTKSIEGKLLELSDYSPTLFDGDELEDDDDEDG